MAINKLRIGGLNSGFDTEAMVKAMSASTMLKLNNNRRKVKKLEAQQTAYRDVISKLQSFRNKYFDILNRSTFLKSSTVFNQFKTTTTVNGEVKNPVGVTISAGANSVPGNYKVELVGKATQTKATANAFASDVGLDFTKLQANTTYGFTVKAGSTKKNIVFSTGTGSQSDIKDAINAELKKAFGTTNSGDGIVKIDHFNGDKAVLTASDKREITFTDSVKLATSSTLTGLEGLKNGENSFTIRIGDETTSVSFNSYGEDFFDIIDKINDASASTLEDKIKEVAKDRYDEMIKNGFAEWTVRSKYAEWQDAAITGGTLNTTMRDDLYAAAFAQAVADDSSLASKYTGSTAASDWVAGEKVSFFDAFKLAEKASPSSYAISPDSSDTLIGSAFNVVKNDTSADGIKSAYVTWLGDNGKDPDDATDFNDLVNFKAFLKDYGTQNGHANDENFAAFKISNDANTYLRVSAFENNVRVEYDSRKTIFDQAIEQKYNEAIYSAYEAWAKETVSGTLTKPVYNSVSKEYDWAAGFPVTDKDKLFEAYYDYRLADQKDKYWTTFYNAHKDDKDSNGDPLYTYADADAMKADYPGNAALKTAFDEAFKKVSLDKAMFINGGYNEYEAFKWAYNEGAATIAAATNSPATLLPGAVQSRADFISMNSYDKADDASRIYNENALKNALESLNWVDGKKLAVSFDGSGEATVEVKDKNGIAITNPLLNISLAGAPDGNTFGIDKAEQAQKSSIALTTTLRELAGTKADDIFKNGTADITINGVKITLKDTYTVTEMMNAVNGSKAGVTMTFSSLTNTFELTAKEYGTGGKVDIDSGSLGADGLLTKLGFTGAPAVEGKNLQVMINDQLVETASNSATINGVTFTFSDAAEVGTEFTTTVAKDPGATVSAIKDFINDYNKLVFEVYAMVREKPQKDYYFLTDYDIEENNMTDRQVEQWEKAAKLGVLYNDSTITSVMEKLRSVMYSPTTSLSGGTFSIYNMRGYDGTVAIKATSDFKMNGMLELDEKALTEALEINPDEIANFFTNTSDGLMKRLEDVLNYAVKSTGDTDSMGVLVQKAGLANGLSSLDNTIFNQIKSLNDTIDTLQRRYDKQQDRYWKQFTNMEKQFSVFNSQSDYITSMFASMNGGKK